MECKWKLETILNYILHLRTYFETSVFESWLYFQHVPAFLRNHDAPTRVLLKVITSHRRRYIILAPYAHWDGLNTVKTYVKAVISEIFSRQNELYYPRLLFVPKQNSKISSFCFIIPLQILFAFHAIKFVVKKKLRFSSVWHYHNVVTCLTFRELLWLPS